MKPYAALFTILFSLSSTPSVFGQQCPDYTCLMAKVERLLKQTQKNYGLILDNGDSAEGYPDAKTD
jgi:hypothetical protein